MLGAYPNYTSTVGQMIRGWLQGAWNVDDSSGSAADFNAYVFQSLQVMNRLENLPEVKRDMAKGDVVLSRYFMSGVVYGADDGVPPDWLERIHSVFPQPDVHLLLDIDVAHSLDRRPTRRDVYERQTGKMQRVVDQYRSIWNERRVTDPLRWVIVNARGTKEETAAQIFGAVASARAAR